MPIDPADVVDDILIRAQEFGGHYMMLTAFQGNKTETTLLRTMDLIIDQSDYETWLKELKNEAHN